MDTLSPEQRSKQMSSVRSKNTKPEMVVRRIVHQMGFRYRLHRKDLPGCPDLVFVKKKKVIFVHGCFWHQHTCKMGQRIPKSRTEFWQKKMQGNKDRDQRAIRQLRRDGWQVLVVWECQVILRNLPPLERKLRKFLEETS